MKCPKCGECKTPVDFHKNRSTKSGLASYCKTCVLKHVKKWTTANPAKVKETKRKWACNNKGYQTEWNLANLERLTEYKKTYKAKSIEELTDSYVAGLFSLPVKYIPKGLIETKRVVLQIKRHLKEIK